MKSCDVMQLKGPTFLHRVILGVLCLRPKAVLGAACVLLGGLLVVGAVKAQSLLNLPSAAPEGQQPPRAAEPQPVLEYQPSRPPLASDPGVLQAPELIARGLNESDAAYTARMAKLGDQLKEDSAIAQQDLTAVLRQVAQAGTGMGSDPVTVQPRPALEVRSPVPPSQRLPQVYDDGRGNKIPVADR